MQGLLVVGLLFGFGFLMVVGLYSALRDVGGMVGDEEPSAADAIPDSKMNSDTGAAGNLQDASARRA